MKSVLEHSEIEMKEQQKNLKYPLASSAGHKDSSMHFHYEFIQFQNNICSKGREVYIF